MISSTTWSQWRHSTKWASTEDAEQQVDRAKRLVRWSIPNLQQNKTNQIPRLVFSQQARVFKAITRPVIHDAPLCASQHVMTKFSLSVSVCTQQMKLYCDFTTTYLLQVLTHLKIPPWLMPGPHPRQLFSRCGQPKPNEVSMELRGHDGNSLWTILPVTKQPPFSVKPSYEWKKNNWFTFNLQGKPTLTMYPLCLSNAWITCGSSNENMNFSGQGSTVISWAQVHVCTSGMGSHQRLMGTLDTLNWFNWTSVLQ